MERTLAVIKPGACNRREAGDIFSYIEAQGLNFRIVRAKYFRMDLDMAHAFYKEHAGKPYYDGLIAHTTSGPCMAIELEGDDVVRRWREFIGPTKPSDGRMDQLRCRFGVGIPDNALHGSDSVESATREISLVFAGTSLTLNPEFQKILDKYLTIGEAAPACPPTCGLPKQPLFGAFPDLPEPKSEPVIQFRRHESIQGSIAKLPIRAKKGDSGLDLYAAEDKLLRTGAATKVSTGWLIELPAAFEGQIRPRSGMSSKGINACFGTIDSEYRGELIVTLFNITGEDYWVKAGDKIAQLVPMPVYDLASCETVGPLSETERGESGFGSTGR